MKTNEIIQKENNKNQDKESESILYLILFGIIVLTVFNLICLLL